MTNKKINFLIDSTVELKQLNILTREDKYASILECRGDKVIKCTLSCTLPLNHHIIKVKLRMPRLTGTSTEFRLASVSEDNILIDLDYNVEVGLENNGTNDDNYQYIDITQKVIGNENGLITFAIKALNSNSYFECENNPEVVIDGISNEYYIPDKLMINKKIGYLSECNLEPLCREFTTTTNLFTLKGGLMPLNLNLVYNHYNGIRPISNFFKFNYDQYIYADGNNYKYVDGQSKVHTFVQSNVTNIYYDVIEPGLILTEYSAGYTISDISNKSINFNLEGKITSISYKESSTVTRTTIIEYENNKLNKITDDLGRQCIFIYNENNIIIRKPDLTEIVLTFDDSILISISGVLNNSENNENILFMYELVNNNILLKSITDPSKNSIVFSYVGNGFIKNVEEYIINGIEQNIISKNTIYSLDKRVTIEKYGITNSLESTTYIEFNDEGNVIKTYENIDDEIVNVKPINRTPYTYMPNNNRYSQKYIISLDPVFDNFQVGTMINGIISPYSQDTEDTITLNTSSDDVFQNYRVETHLKICDKSNVDPDSKEHIIVELICLAGGEEHKLYQEKINLNNIYNYYVLDDTFKIPRTSNAVIFLRLMVKDCIVYIGMKDIVIKKSSIFGEYCCVINNGNTLTYPYVENEWINISKINELIVGDKSILMYDSDYNMTNSITINIEKSL